MDREAAGLLAASLHGLMDHIQDEERETSAANIMNILIKSEKEKKEENDENETDLRISALFASVLKQRGLAGNDEPSSDSPMAASALEWLGKVAKAGISSN
jgi:hypothetical protein